MNFLFGFVIALLVPAGLYLVYKFAIPRQVWAALPPDVERWREPAARAIAALIFIAILISTAGTYGPRNELADSTYRPDVESVEIESGEPWSDTEDRFGNANELLDEAPVRAEDLTDAAEDNDDDNDTGNNGT